MAKVPHKWLSASFNVETDRVVIERSGAGGDLLMNLPKAIDMHKNMSEEDYRKPMLLKALGGHVLCLKNTK